MTMTDHEQVLDFWHSVEFFNAYDLDQPLDAARKSRSVERLTETWLASGLWDKYLGHRRVLYLLPFDVTHVTRMIEDYVDSPSISEVAKVRDGEMAATGLTCYAKLTLGPNGEPNFESLSVSALPWALGRLASGDIGALCAVTFDESVRELKRVLADEQSQWADKRLGAKQLPQVLKHLEQWAGWTLPQTDLAYMDIWPIAKPRNGAVSVQPDEVSTDSPEPMAPADELVILNSFYVHDLVQAKRLLSSERPARALRAYLSTLDPQKLDLDSESGQQAINRTLRPENGIGGRWPAASQHVQSLMQQFALNTMGAMDEGEILAVNGPPGTGKTTLLRDLIADLVVGRADALAQLTVAKDGLSDQVIDAVFSKKSYRIPLLSETLTGFEMLVASTNNGAVENLSLELPQLKGIDAARVQHLSYFQEVATRYAGCQGDKPWKTPEPVWGLVAAALGRKSNRRRLRDIFGNRAATPADKPGDTFIAKSKVDLGSWEKVGAMTYWHFKSSTRHRQLGFKVAKERYLKARKIHDEQRQRLQVLCALYERLQQAFPAVQALWPAAPRLSPQHLASLIEGTQRLLERLEAKKNTLERKLGPAWWRWLAQWFRKPLYQQWVSASDDLELARAFESELRDLPGLIQECGVYLWDGAPLDSQANQQHAFWQGAAFNEARSDLFVAAMTLHEAFFLEVASPDLVFALSAMLERPPLLPARRALWQWLFMLTPVVSSTFASIRAQFAGLEAEDLGWLIIDEAGQAPPQAAVGAIMRAKRVVVVGDPLQIEPVVTQSTRLLDTLGRHWLGDSRSRYAIDSHSVQTFADRGYGQGVRHPLDAEKFIGIPLVMHRRCDNPMFEISNRIAYAQRMRHAKDSGIVAHPLLGASAWWSVSGESADGTKYIEVQGQRLLRELAKLYQAALRDGGALLPPVFVITPFREVKAGLVSLLGNAAAWRRVLGAEVPPPANLAGWVSSCIGTVHTFQGKEADIVFFVLGCDSTRMGAIDWACSTPNLLNVAVTRAKKHLYILGDQNLWGDRQYFEVARDLLSRAQVQHPASEAMAAAPS
ncbi:DEAD/DEAH box helicase [Pseudomonas protegens]|uniref:DEAD/DEAH box helicase n=1 Tax=Pseudomonas protegens TaxID=380021 RepID=UPI00380862D5